MSNWQAQIRAERHLSPDRRMHPQESAATTDDALKANLQRMGA